MQWQQCCSKDLQPPSGTNVVESVRRVGWAEGCSAHTRVSLRSARFMKDCFAGWVDLMALPASLSLLEFRVSRMPSGTHTAASRSIHSTLWTVVQTEEVKVGQSGCSVRGASVLKLLLFWSIDAYQCREKDHGVSPCIIAHHHAMVRAKTLLICISVTS